MALTTIFSHSFPPPPEPVVRFPRPFSDMTSFDSRTPSFAAQYQTQQGQYADSGAHGHQSNMSHTSGSFRSFGEVNGQSQQGSTHEPQIYTAVYSGVAVYEMEVHNVAVMKRRHDSWLNATQILKVARIDKGRRTKILEKEILTGEYEKVQGGYGKYQGTWINYQRGREFCRQYCVEELLRPLLDYDTGNDGPNTTNNVDTPTKEQAMAANRRKFYSAGVDNRVNGQLGGGTFFQNISPTASTALAAMNKAARFESPMPRPGSAQKRPAPAARRPSQHNSQDSGFPGGSQQSIHSMQSFTSDQGGDASMHGDSGYGTSSAQSNSKNSEIHEPPRKKMRPSSSHDLSNLVEPSVHDEVMTEPNESFSHQPIMRDGEGPLAMPPLPQPSDRAGEEKRLALLDLFSDLSRTDFSNHTAILHLSGRDLDIPLDPSANTALHWAATLARVPLMRLLISKGANNMRGNAAGQTPLMAAVQVNNNFDQSCFPEMLELLGQLIEIRDATGRTVLHHIAVSSGIHGRGVSSRYYLESLLEFMVRKGSSNPNSQQNSFEDGAAFAKSSRPIGLVKFMSEVVNVQDKSGNTALNLVARIGNRAIINQLEEVGADYSIPNRSGVKPTDFGVFPRSQPAAAQSPSKAASSSQAKTPSQIEQIREEIFATTTSILSQTQAQYSGELQKKQALLDQQKAELLEIAAQHKTESERLQNLQDRSKARNDRQQKILNLQRAVKEQKARLNGKSTSDSHRREPDLTGVPIDPSLLSALGSPSSLQEVTSQQRSLAESLPSADVLRASLAAYQANNAALQSRVAALKERSLELESQCRKAVSLCTGLDESQVDARLNSLIMAVESEGRQGVDVGRIRDFMRLLGT